MKRAAKPTVLYHRNDATKTRLDILSVAADIASAEGLEGLSIGRLANELGMSKTGIFAHFGSKQQLQLATVDSAREIFLKRVVQPALKHERGARRLRAMLESWLAYVEQIVFRGGCFFAAASAEFDSRPGPVRDQIAQLTRSWLVGLQEETAVAVANKEFRAAIDPAQFAFELHAFVQEANWAFKLFNDKFAFTRARRAFRNKIAAAQLQHRSEKSK